MNKQIEDLIKSINEVCEYRQARITAIVDSGKSNTWLLDAIQDALVINEYQYIVSTYLDGYDDIDVVTNKLMARKEFHELVKPRCIRNDELIERLVHQISVECVTNVINQLNGVGYVR